MLHLMEEPKRQQAPSTCSVQALEMLSLPGEIIKANKNQQDGMQTAWFQFRKEKHAFSEQEKVTATAVSTRPLAGHQLLQDRQDLNAALNAGMAGGGPVEMAEHRSKCRSDLSRLAAEQLNPRFSCPRGVTRWLRRLQECSKLSPEQGIRAVQCSQLLSRIRYLLEAESSHGYKTGSCK